ncbi:MAG TPA: dihydroxyacetone kinase subunit DhaK [Clostridia bacterium]|nr:dihydroxyacetone kinase subunit DhaK [Clostridia bacterium]
MKKIINNPKNLVEELLDGYIAAYGDIYERVPGVNGFVVKNKKDKVALLIGGGSGHEPLFPGFAGEGLADAVAMGNIFASPNPATILEVTKAIDCGKGVLYVYGNYAGDNLNFDMAEEMANASGIQTSSVRVWDDVASAPLERIDDRRGIAGDLFVIKTAGAATAMGLSLEEATRVTKKARDSVRTIGVSLAPGSIPGSDKATFELPEDEIEFGMGLHGEPGVKRTKMMPADELTSIMMDHIINDLPFQSGDEVCVLINGLGSTTFLELFIVNRKVSQILESKGIKVYDTNVGSYCTCQEMAGASITLIRLDEELKKYYDYPAFSPYYTKK